MCARIASACLIAYLHNTSQVYQLTSPSSPQRLKGQPTRSSRLRPDPPSHRPFSTPHSLSTSRPYQSISYYSAPISPTLASKLSLGALNRCTFSAALFPSVILSFTESPLSFFLKCTNERFFGGGPICALKCGGGGVIGESGESGESGRRGESQENGERVEGEGNGERRECMLEPREERLMKSQPM